MGMTMRGQNASESAKVPNAVIMQLGDIMADGSFDYKALRPTQVDQSNMKFIAKPGDLIFRGRGASIAATVVFETPLPIVVAAPLVLIRPNHSEIDPGFLAWSLTNKSARRYYSDRSQGSVIVGIGKRDLAEMKIALPAMKSQKKIGNLKRLLAKESQLKERLAVAKNQLMETILEDLVQKESL